MNTEPANLSAYKQQLLLRSEANRIALGNALGEVGEAAAWVPRAVEKFRAVSPVMLLLGPTLAVFAGRWVFGRRAPAVTAATAAPAGKLARLFSKVMMGVRLFQEVKPLLDGYRRARGMM